MVEIILSHRNIFLLFLNFMKHEHLTPKYTRVKALDKRGALFFLFLHLPILSTFNLDTELFQGNSNEYLQFSSNEVILINIKFASPRWFLWVSTMFHDSSITKTRLYNFDPLKPHFYIVKLGFTGVYIICLISTQKHILWVLVRTALSRQF